MTYSKELNTSNYNISILNNLLLEETKGRGLKPKEFEKNQKILMLAATHILGDTELYTTGKKRISKRQCRQIKDKITEIKDKIAEKRQRKQAKLARKSTFFETKIDILRNNEQTKPIDKFEDFYQLMGCNVSYRKWSVGDIIPGPDPTLSDYKVEKVIKNSKGLQIVVLAPVDTTDKNAAPILCCRGTTSNPHNFIDDMNKHIGRYSFEESKDEIGQVLQEMTAKYGSTVITGHSLGGAIVQTIAAEFCGQTLDDGTPLIKSGYYFSAPGVGNETAMEFEHKKSQILDPEKRPKMYEYYHAGDLVVLAGGSHLPADARKEVGDHTISNYTSARSIKHTHSWPNLISEYNEPRVVEQMSPGRARLRKGIEFLRQGIASIFKRIILAHVENQKNMKILAEKISEFILFSSDERSKMIKTEDGATFRKLENFEFQTPKTVGPFFWQ